MKTLQIALVLFVVISLGQGQAAAALDFSAAGGVNRYSGHTYLAGSLTAELDKLALEINGQVSETTSEMWGDVEFNARVRAGVIGKNLSLAASVLLAGYANEAGANNASVGAGPILTLS